MFLQKVLGFDVKSMNLRTELIAGATTFLTMCYILAVNPSILSTPQAWIKARSSRPQPSLQPLLLCSWR